MAIPPRPDRESIELAKAEAARERVQAAQDLVRVDARYALKRLVEAVGCQQLVSWLWMEAALRGEELTLPVQDSEVRR